MTMKTRVAIMISALGIGILVIALFESFNIKQGTWVFIVLAQLYLLCHSDQIRQAWKEEQWLRKKGNEAIPS